MKNRFSPPIIFRVALLIVLLIPLSVFTSGIEIDQADNHLVNGVYLLNAHIEFDFDEEVIEALDNGVVLQIDVTIRVKRNRKWIWDKTIHEQIMEYKLEHHALSDNYLITDMTNNLRHQRPSLSEALALLGTIKDQELIAETDIDTNASYTGFIRANLDVESLPPPLRPIAYASDKWKLKSVWQKWELK